MSETTKETQEMKETPETEKNAAAVDAPVAKKTWKDRIPTLIAITTLFLAVCATLASFKAGGYSTKMVLAQSQASDQWAYYQAKSIKETAYQTQRDMMSLIQLTTPAIEKEFREKTAEYDKEIARYKKEKAEIMADAKKLEQARDDYQVYGGNFGRALILLQIGILFSSLSSISKNHVYWYAGAISGAGGIAAFFYALAIAP